MMLSRRMWSSTLLVWALFGCSVKVGQVREPEPAKAKAAAPAAEAPAEAAPAVAEAAPEKRKKKGKGKKGKGKKGEGKDAGTEAVADAPAELGAALQTLSVPIRVPLAAVREEIEKRVPASYAHGWERVTKRGANPSIDARVTVWRDAIGLRVEGEVVHVELPLRYAAEIRGKAKAPFGKSISLAKGQTWGTEAAPQRMTLRGRARIAVSDKWELDVALELDAPKHGTAPSGSLCTSGSFTICTPKDTIAPLVRKRLDAEIAKRFKRLDGVLAKHVRDTVRLPSRVETLWNLLGCPIPLDPGVKFDCGKRKAPKRATRWLVLEPIAADVTFRGEGDALVVEPSVTARIEHVDGTAPPRREVPPLPGRGKTRKGKRAAPVGDTTIAVEELRRLVRDRVGPALVREVLQQ